jgi:gluconate 2-dehydrogenase gamma chain
LRGLLWMDARSQELFGAPFVSATPAQQTALLTSLSSPSDKSTADPIGREFFDAIKGLTVTGYYTSEIGIRQELGEDGNLFFAEFPGCTHPQHKG